MRVFFDTSVLVAALFEGHAFHRQAFPWLKRAREREFSFLVATHTLAELYSALTSLPVKPKITPGAAQELALAALPAILRPAWRATKVDPSSLFRTS